MLVEITAEAYGLEIDLLYATPLNFTGARSTVEPPAICIRIQRCCWRARPSWREFGLRLRLFDARPPGGSADPLASPPDPAYIADPRRGSPHSMGAAVDLTLIEADSGRALDMGTGFDDMRPLSWHGDTGVSAGRNITALLLGLMTAAGFDYSGMNGGITSYSAARPLSVLSDSVLPVGLMWLRQSGTPPRRPAARCADAASRRRHNRYCTGSSERIVVLAKKASSTLAFSNPDIGPQSRPRARAARMKYPLCKVPLRKAVVSISLSLPANQDRASVCGKSSGSRS